jgi:transposase-like protein
LFKVRNEFVWLWIAIEPIDKIILGIRISFERTMLIAERFLYNQEGSLDSSHNGKYSRKIDIFVTYVRNSGERGGNVGTKDLSKLID